jgi:TolB-like protein
MIRRASLVAVAFVLAASSAHALQSPTVAVMPFKDLAGGKSTIGEAIRETVTSDLRDVPGLKVIERSFIDKVLAEQNLQASKADLDPTSTVKVGKLLGASLIVAGAYQKASSSVRLTARFVKVETGEIVGTAKVDGPASDFLHLQDRVTTELLKSAGIEQKHVVKFAARPRPKLKSLKPIELYGDAVVETDDSKRREKLKAAINEDPSFVYASRDLDELERRLREYDAIRNLEQNKELKVLFEQLNTEKDPQKQAMIFFQIYPKLAMSRRWILLARLSRQLLEKKPPLAMPGMDVNEILSFNLIQAASMSKDHDRVLREGEKFLSKYATGNYFMSVKSMMEQSIEWKRSVEDGQKSGPAAVAALSPSEQADPCKLGMVWNEHKQLANARREFERCLKNRPSIWPASLPLQMLLVIATQQGDVVAARSYLKQLETVDPAAYKSFKAFEMQWPADL